MPRTQAIKDALDDGMHPEDVLFVVLLARWREQGCPRISPPAENEQPVVPLAAPRRLTPAERLALEVYAVSPTAAATADTLGISYHTVVQHLKRARSKLGTTTTVAAIIRARDLGWIDVPTNRAA